MICLKCLGSNFDTVGKCLDCGFNIDLNRKITTLKDFEYQQLDIVDMSNVLKENGSLESFTLDTINIQADAFRLVYKNCNHPIKATFVGIHKTSGNKNNSDGEHSCLYPIFRYEYNGKVYFVEDCEECSYVLGVNTTYKIGKEYDIFIDPDRPYIMSLKDNSGFNPSMQITMFKTIGIVAYLIKLFLILPFLLVFGFIIISFVFTAYPLKSFGFGYDTYDATFVNKVHCGEVFDDSNSCLGLYEYYIDGVKYEAETKHFSDGFNEKAKVKVKGNDTNNAIVVEGLNSTTLFFIGFISIFAIILIREFIVTIKEIIRIKSGNS